MKFCRGPESIHCFRRSWICSYSGSWLLEYHRGTCQQRLTSFMMPTETRILHDNVVTSPYHPNKTRSYYYSSGVSYNAHVCSCYCSHGTRGNLNYCIPWTHRPSTIIDTCMRAACLLPYTEFLILTGDIANLLTFPLLACLIFHKH